MMGSFVWAVDRLLGAVLLYNLAAGGVVVVGLTWVWRGRSVSAFLASSVGVVGGVGALAVAASAVSIWGGFPVALFAAYGVFLHGVIFFIGSAAGLWWRHRVAAVFSGLLALGLAGIAVDAFLVEPTWLEVSYYSVPSSKITRPVRIVLLADLQTDRLGDYERRVLRRVMAENPDLVLLAGDYLQAAWGESESLRARVNAYLRQIGFSAPLGVYAVQGNVDPEDWPALFSGLPVTATSVTRSYEVGELRVTCLAERRSFSPVLEVSNDDPGRFHIVLGHSPNFALGRIEADLLVAGHTHGGQARLPGWGPVVNASRLDRGRAAGMSRTPGGAVLVVSRGIGMERRAAPRLRFCCRPELVVIDVVPAP